MYVCLSERHQCVHCQNVHPQRESCERRTRIEAKTNTIQCFEQLVRNSFEYHGKFHNPFEHVIITRYRILGFGALFTYEQFFDSFFSIIFLQPSKRKYGPRKLVSKAKINLNKYWHKFEEILTAAGEDIKMMSSSYHDFIASQKIKYHSVDRPATPDMLASTKLNLFSSLRQPPANNVQDQLKTLMGKSFDTGDDDEKNLNDSTSSYKPFTGDDLYYGVNLNTILLPSEPIASGVEKNRLKRCSCHLEASTSERKQQQVAKRPSSFHALPRNYQFSHRNIQLTDEDYQNLENEAMEVCQKYSYYDTSF